MWHEAGVSKDVSFVGLSVSAAMIQLSLRTTAGRAVLMSDFSAKKVDYHSVPPSPPPRPPSLTSDQGQLVSGRAGERVTD